MKTAIITFSLVLILGLFGVLWWVSTSNSEITLRNRISNQQDVTEIFYTKLWEILQSKAGVTSEYATQFKEIQFGIMEGRYSNGGGSLMKWIQESNPQFDSSLYKDLMNSIEGERNGFFIEQKKLLDMSRQHSDMLMTFPSKIVLKNRESIDVVILKNLATRQAFETGTDSSPSLF